MMPASSTSHFSNPSTPSSAQSGSSTASATTSGTSRAMAAPPTTSGSSTVSSASSLGMGLPHMSSSTTSCGGASRKPSEERDCSPWIMPAQAGCAESISGAQQLGTFGIPISEPTSRDFQYLAWIESSSSWRCCSRRTSSVWLTWWMHSTGQHSIASLIFSSSSPPCWKTRARPKSSSSMNVFGATKRQCVQPMHVTSSTKTNFVGRFSVPTNCDDGKSCWMRRWVADKSGLIVSLRVKISSMRSRPRASRSSSSSSGA
mmetsp:Transcript_13074/g.34076  ORF Transcript_13074/g.34076 Transcript_13074/m.34076 type:complete len:259 (+) Transcript_13074:499-1275(+)